ncbi:DnaJ domain/C2H2 type zinc-finger (2 copies)/Zinc-finger of C2H2 type/Zinc-finger double-stranded RNA-binding, putative [Leishmania donovani]|uniref:DnaJ domain/C2H2 type zinc-finger (2 copies)/Zinc-finger of C2H2 type/Zinc-finger double-stranded RNA-binding, putative n=1 Tax=Leishmania donovani TaxID=5661 RepID=A0A3Q8IDF1_LEIDO|nr:DnaJ domain/C2H2 type zinc-finger (2 copies)/Zinc-finger of C2H2 type/Zinc-finger double-stranded RNA-binding, putative [Leishmania donovani]
MGEGRIRCYYEVLEVERKATYDEIRAAYKKKSLQYHPDKNYGNQEEAAMRFKEVQNAYSILSDADERAWYDSHREAILRGGDGTGDADELNLYEFFTAGCFDGFDDSESGFYAVYRKVFDMLIEEESDYDSRAKLWPGFGTSTSDWADVQKFYGHWRNFGTYKTFTWKDEYKVNEMEDRYSRRMAGRINSKARDGAKKEYVRTVQSLAQFVYRRDPRVKAELERQEEEEQAKREERERQEIERLKRRREANERVWAEAAEREAREEAERAARGEAMDGSILEMLYEKERQTKEMMRGNGGAGAHTAGFAMLGGDDDEVVTVFNCPACKKQFKSENQYKEHVRSNKHKTKLKQLAAKGTDVAALMGEKVEGSSGGTEE